MTIMQSIKRIYLLVAASCLLLLNACKKSDSFNTSELHVYAASGTLAYNVIQGNFNVIGAQVFAGPGTSFPVLLTRAVDRDIQVSISIDTSLVRVYDSINKLTTPSAKIPAGAFGLQQNGLITIPAGQTASAVAAQVELKNPALLTEGISYIIPVVINNANNGVPVSASRNIVFIKTQLKVIKAGISSLTNTNTISLVLNKANNTVTGPGALYLKAVLNDQLSGSTQITVEDVPSLLAAYNQQTGGNFIAMPASSYQLQKPSVTIPEKATNSADSIVISLPNLQLFQTGNNYLLPVQIKTAKNQSTDIPADDTKKVVYIQVSVFENNIDPANSGLTGTTINRTGWTVTASGSYSGNAVTRVLDGNNATAWDSDGRMPAWVQLDMGTAKIVKGFPIVPSYEYRTDNFIEMEVYSSNNGTTWKLEGKYTGTTTSASSTAANPDIKTVRFMTPVTARYFKFNITKTTDGSYAGMAELNAME
jgi:hypothetical protein